MQQALNGKIHTFLITAIAFCLPIHSDIIPPLIVLASINWVLCPAEISNGISNLTRNKSALAIVTLFLIYALSILYSDNVGEGMKVIESKLSFIILPLIFSTQTKNIKKNLNTCLRFFIYGCIIVALFSLSWATYSYIKPVFVLIDGREYNLGLNYFYYAQLTNTLHPTYLSMYFNFSLLALYYLIKTGEIKLDFKWIFSILLFTIFIFLLSSKAGWISLFLIAFYVILNILQRKYIFSIILIVSISASLFYFLNINAPGHSQRITAAKESVSQAESSSDLKKSNDGTASRILVWQAAIEVIRANFLIGAGAGDTKSTMLKKYKENGMVHEYEQKLNAHNQYLNTFIALGVFGFLILLSCLLIPLIYAINNKQMLIGTFVCLIAYNFLFESMLETQAGVMFYAFFNSMLCFNTTSKS